MSEIFSPGSIAGPPVIFMGPYSTAITYSIGQAASSGGSSYISLVNANTGNIPANSPTQWALLAAAGAASASVEVSELFSAASSITVTHGLNTLTPIIQGRVLSGATRWSAFAVDGNNTTITSTGPMNIVLTFLGGVAPTQTGPAAPVITQQPGSTGHDVAGMVTFAANASGSPAPSAQWQTDSGTGATWADVSGATGTTYAVTDIGKDGWQYRAVFTNASGTATTSASKVMIAVTTVGLVNYWPMNEGTGSIFVDTIAANNLTAQGVTWTGTTPEFSGANGASGALGASPAPLNNATTPFTISTWANLSLAALATSPYLLTNRMGGPPGYMLGLFNNGVDFGLLIFPGGDCAINVTCRVAVAQDIRHNFIATYDGSGTAAGLQFYMNGLQLTKNVATDTLAGAAVTPQGIMSIMAQDGQNGGSSTQNNVAGSMDSLRIYNRVLTSGDIALIQTRGN